MISGNRIVGGEGEALAADFLMRKGWRVLARGARVGRIGEIDLIMRDEATIVFVEVKTRRGARFGLPEEAMTPAKRLHFLRAIHAWLERHGLSAARYRADVVAVDRSAEPPDIRHHRAVEL